MFIHNGPFERAARGRLKRTASTKLHLQISDTQFRSGKETQKHFTERGQRYQLLHQDHFI